METIMAILIIILIVFMIVAFLIVLTIIHSRDYYEDMNAIYEEEYRKNCSTTNNVK